MNLSKNVSFSAIIACALTIPTLDCVATNTNSAANCTAKTIMSKISSDANNSNLVISNYTWSNNTLASGRYQTKTCGYFQGSYSYTCNYPETVTTTYVYKTSAGATSSTCNIVCNSSGVPQGTFSYSGSTLTYKSSV